MVNVILYYNFSRIDDPEAFCRDHRRKCEELGLLGRVYIAAEGINGTLSGLPEKISAYKEYLCSLPGFSDTEFKEDIADKDQFVKLIVRTRPEIVALKQGEFDPRHEGGKHLSPAEWRKQLEQDKDFVLIDVRNNYESQVGYFEGAIRPDVENFYDFPKWLESARIEKGKKILMYCTGGIRCEKFSAFMKKKGYEDIYQLHGGIINYGKEEGGAHFKGKCFVFDDRLTVPVNATETEPVSRCAITDVPCDTFINCHNLDCNSLFICSREGAIAMEGCCSQECRKASNKKPFNVDDIYTPTRKRYTYHLQTTSNNSQKISKV